MTAGGAAVVDVTIFCTVLDGWAVDGALVAKENISCELNMFNCVNIQRERLQGLAT